MAGYDGTQMRGALGGFFKGQAINRDMMQDLANLEQTKTSTELNRLSLEQKKEMQPFLLEKQKLENEGIGIDHESKRLDQAGKMQAENKEDMAQFADRQRTVALEISELPPGMQWEYAKEAFKDNPKGQHFMDSLQAANMQGMIPKNPDGSAATLSQILTRMSEKTMEQDVKMRIAQLNAQTDIKTTGMKGQNNLEAVNLRNANDWKIAQLDAAVKRQIANARLAADKAGADVPKTFEQQANAYFNAAMAEKDPEKKAMLLHAANEFRAAAVQLRPAPEQQAQLQDGQIVYKDRERPVTPFNMPGVGAAPATAPTAPATPAAGTQPVPGAPAKGQRFEAKNKDDAKKLMGSAKSGDTIIYNGKAYTKP